MMFDPTDAPRVFAVPLGQDFSQVLYDGLNTRLAALDPIAASQAEIYVNTRRMQRRLTDLFHTGPARLLPRIRLVTDIAADLGPDPVAPAIAPLRRRLEVTQLVRGLIDADPTLASKDAAFDLADALVSLMAEMQGEGVAPDVLKSLDVTDQSGHWQRALDFVMLVQTFFDPDAQPDNDGRQRRLVEHLLSRWDASPPDHPIIVAGSTGSRGSTSLFMQAVARLPQGALILPGVDLDMPVHVWDRMADNDGAEDHPQYRFKTLCDTLNIAPHALPLWTDEPSDRAARTKLISLSLTPAPVTDDWVTEGPKLQDLDAATQDMTLIEAPSPRAEADAIAACLRHAVEVGKTAALITRDRMLTRQVTAALDRWGILPDDSAGLPLQLTAPGRLLRHTADLFTGPITAEDLLIVLRHPLTNSAADDRGDHNLHTNALELQLRRHGPPFPTPDSLRNWAEETSEKAPSRPAWANWVATHILAPQSNCTSLSDHVTRHITFTEALGAGPMGDTSGELWKEAAGREALRMMRDLALHADAGGDMNAREYRQLVSSLLAAGEVRNPDNGHPGVLIWGTLEARVQSADLVILGGLNEGSWPEAPAADPWLNRAMRQQAGLLLPERRIGLSAHDYQQAVCAQEVVISRAVRSDEAETVPSRWLNRLVNLLGGLTADADSPYLRAMRDRGRVWLQLAEQIAAPDAPVDPAPRPSPRPPADVRPEKLSVTQIKTLIRDPYAIYARSVLGLRKLDDLTQTADAPLRGIIIHEILERFINARIDPTDASAPDALMAIADTVLDAECPWPAMRRLWRARIASFTDHFLAEEVTRQTNVAHMQTELWGELTFPKLPFTLTCKADRIDTTEDGHALIYDYKTGTAPTKAVQLNFDKQLLLEAGMVERGAFKALGPKPVQAATFIGLGSDLKNQSAPLKDAPPDDTLTRFEMLMAKWLDETMGYTSRRANATLTTAGDYDHLARYGEWDETSDATPQVLS